MSLVDKIASGAKKGLDWFTFNDGLLVQQKYLLQARDTASHMLGLKVVGTTLLYHSLTATIPGILYASAIHYATTHNTVTFSQVYLGCFLTMGLEKTRSHIRSHFFSQHHEIFARQVVRTLRDNVLPEQILSIDGPEPHSFEKDPDYWKNCD